MEEKSEQFWFYLIFFNWIFVFYIEEVYFAVELSVYSFIKTMIIDLDYQFVQINMRTYLKEIIFIKQKQK